MSTPSRGTSGSFEGRFSDGRTAAASPAAVRLVPQGIEIAPAGGQMPFVWLYGELAAASPVSRSEGDVLLSSSASPGTALFVADSAFGAALADRAPHLTAASQRWRFARPLLAICVFVGLAVAGLWALDVSPARSLAGMLPGELRRSVGRQVVESMNKGRGICETPEGSAALIELTKRLSTAAGGKRFDIHVIDWTLVNAFAAPGEQIVLTRGILEQATGPDEVAGVLAHEMGHGLELHPETAIIRVLGLSAAVEFMFGGSGGVLANVGVLLTQLGYSRVAEREADAHALDILQKAQISSQGFADFFKRMEERERGSVIGGIGLLRTHPFSAERARLAESRPAYAASPALADADWHALQAICGRRGKGV